jgi:hypothetical protein
MGYCGEFGDTPLQEEARYAVPLRLSGASGSTLSKRSSKRNPQTIGENMYPEDRVLVAYLPRPHDFSIVKNEGWYRIPQQHAPKGIYAEYVAFYFGRQFGPQKWAIHYYARRLGHELVRRNLLFPEEVDHPRANELYYKLQMGPLQLRERPIVSLRWRRITFLHTTWDRFQDATEINDLLLDGGAYIDRLYATLKERGVKAERHYRLEEDGEEYEVPMSAFGPRGRFDLDLSQVPESEEQLQALVTRIVQQIN